jgi:hypothetical protein
LRCEAESAATTEEFFSLRSHRIYSSLAMTRAVQDTKVPLIYQAHFDETLVIYDYMTGLPISEATADKFPQQQGKTSVHAPLPASGESIDDPKASPNNHPRVITVEVGGA